MNSSPPILKFSDVSVESSPHYETELWNISFALNPGDLLLVRIERENERLPLADASEGLVQPKPGSVMFLGEDWQSMSADHAAAQRGKIGRLFEGEGWVSDLEVDQNIVLSQRHHTRRSEEEILGEALQFARVFGLPGLPRGRPGSVRRPDLRKAACIRAFLPLSPLQRPSTCRHRSRTGDRPRACRGDGRARARRQLAGRDRVHDLSPRA